jgi:cell division protein FtsL
MAAAQSSLPTVRRRSCWTGTPEVYFAKSIDNSRLVKVEDPRRHREMKQFGIALSCLFLLVMTFAWQHFKAIEYGYKIESLRSQRDGLTELNRALRLEEASLRDPERIDILARQLGMQPPQAGQVVRMDAAGPEAGAPVMASITPISVVSAR